MLRSTLTCKIISLWITGLILSACGGGSVTITNEPPAAPQEEGTDVPFRVVATFDVPVFAPFAIIPTNLIAKNASDWSMMWDMYQEYETPKKPLPGINFNREQVIGVVRAATNSCGLPVFKRVSKKENVLFIEVDKKEAAPGTFCSAAYTIEVVFVAVPRSSLTVVFSDTK